MVKTINVWPAWIFGWLILHLEGVQLARLTGRHVLYICMGIFFTFHNPSDQPQLHNKSKRLFGYVGDWVGIIQTLGVIFIYNSAIHEQWYIDMHASDGANGPVC